MGWHRDRRIAERSENRARNAFIERFIAQQSRCGVEGCNEPGKRTGEIWRCADHWPAVVS